MSKTASAYGRLRRARLAYRPVLGERKSGTMRHKISSRSREIQAGCATRAKELLTPSGSGDTSASHDHDPASVPVFDHLRNGGDRALGQCGWRGVILNEAGLVLAHLPSRRLLPGAGSFLLVTCAPTATYLGGIGWTGGREVRGMCAVVGVLCCARQFDVC